MAVAEMSAMTLVGLSHEKNSLLDALQRTGAVQLKSAKEYPFADIGAAPDVKDADVERVERALGYISSVMDGLPKEKRTFADDGFGVTKEEFFAIGAKAEELNAVLTRTEQIAARRAEIQAEKTKTEAHKKSYLPYVCVNFPFTHYADTKNVFVYLGLVAQDKTAKLAESAENSVAVGVVGASVSGNVVCVAALKGDKGSAEEAMSAVDFQKCTFTDDKTAAEIVAEDERAIAALCSEDDALVEEICLLSQHSRNLKLYSDYLAFCREKLLADGKMGKTRSAYVLEAYVPTEATERVKAAVEQTASAYYLGFEAIPRDQFAPTLMKNGKIAENFEAVTNLYSAPAYGALDPNAVMSFFFSLFMGILMADVGYGLLMIVGGFLFASKKRDGTTVKRMAKVFAYGGFFAVLFGVLFDSWMGFQLLHVLFENAGNTAYAQFYSAHIDQLTMSSLAGINVPTMLLWCLGLGTVQIAVGQVMKAVQSFGRGRYAEGIFGGIVWAIALLAFVVWVFGMVTQNDALSTYGMYVAAGFAVLGVLTAGITEKGFGKVTKVFTSAYGIINYVSDILSYARLYGLMLSGAQIAAIFTNTIAVQMLFPQGVFGVIAGILVIIVGNVFNLAMNLLGAYIHDARLQYVEFYGKFYEGEGELFQPFGGVNAHTYFKA